MASFLTVIPTLLWFKLQSFLKGIHDDSEEPNHHSPKSPMEHPLDTDVEAFSNNHGTYTLPPSPETIISETPPTSSRWLPLGRRPSFVRNSVTQQHTESDSTPQSATTATATGTPQQETSNPIAQIFQDQELGKVVIGVVMPMTAALLNTDVPVTSLMKKVILLSISLGFVALWNGILLRQTLPRYAMAIEQLGAAFVLLAFYALVSSFFPAPLVWLPLISFALVVFPFFLSYYLRRLTDGGQKFDGMN